MREYIKKWQKNKEYIKKERVYSTDLVGMSEKLGGVSRIGVSENDGCGGHSGGGFSGEIRPGITGINPISPSVSGHLLRPLPTVMVRITISHLNSKPPQQHQHQPTFLTTQNTTHFNYYNFLFKLTS